MELDKITIGEAKRLIAEADELRKFLGQEPAQASAAGDAGLWVVGECYFIRTVTHHLLGRLVAVTEHELWIEEASWIADDGRFSELLTGGEAAEVEPAPAGSVAVGRGSLIDAYRWTHPLLRVVK